MTGVLIALTLAATHALCFAAGGWYLRYRALIHQMRAAQTATTGQHRVAVLADYRRQLRHIVRLPHLHVRERPMTTPACCICDPAKCAADDTGEHCNTQSCGSCLHGCPAPEGTCCPTVRTDNLEELAAWYATNAVTR